jgi:hypothetical protein
MENDSEQLDPDWAEVLNLLYMSSDGRVFVEDKEDGKHRIKNEAGELTFSNTILPDMADANLVYKIDQSRYKLTESGFKLAHERQMQKKKQANEAQRATRSEKINKIAALLTLSLVLTNVIDSGVRVAVGRDSILEGYIYVFLGVILIIGITETLRRDGPLSTS